MNNVNPQEVEKFAALASRWWGEGSGLRATGSQLHERPACGGRAGARGSSSGGCRE